jgi:hypothetical protein
MTDKNNRLIRTLSERTEPTNLWMQTLCPLLWDCGSETTMGWTPDDIYYVVMVAYFPVFLSWGILLMFSFRMDGDLKRLWKMLDIIRLFPLGLYLIVLFPIWHLGLYDLMDNQSTGMFLTLIRLVRRTLDGTKVGDLMSDNLKTLFGICGEHVDISVHTWLIAIVSSVIILLQDRLVRSNQAVLFYYPLLAMIGLRHAHQVLENIFCVKTVGIVAVDARIDVWNSQI